MGSLWKVYHEAQKARRKIRLDRRERDILRLRRFGFEVLKVHPGCYRVSASVGEGREEYLDLFPLHNIFFDDRLNRRGNYKEVISFVRDYFGKLKEKGELK